MINKLIVEFIGTFFLVLTVGCTVIAGGNSVIPPLAIGSVLMGMIYAGGHISGAHYNPAVTLAVFIRGRCAAAEVAPYMGTQMIAAVAAALMVQFLKPDAVVVAAAIDTTKALTAEFLFTFALVYVILNSATAKATSGNSYYGLAIGFTVLSGAFTAGNISGGAFNPAVAVGAAVLGLFSWSNIWIYFVANFAAGAAGAMLFKKLNPSDAS